MSSPAQPLITAAALRGAVAESRSRGQVIRPLGQPHDEEEETMSRPKKVQTPPTGASAGAAPGTATTETTSEAPSRKAGRPRKVTVAMPAPAPRGSQQAARFGRWSDGTVHIEAPSCKGVLTREEFDALLAFHNGEGMVSTFPPPKHIGVPVARKRRGGRPRKGEG